MKTILSAALVLGFCGLAGAEGKKADPVGTWKCDYEIGGQKLEATLKVKKDGDKFAGTMSWPNQKETKLKDVKLKDGELSFSAVREIMDMKLTVEYKVNFLAPAQGERMVARARVVRPGRTVTACAGDVFAVIGGQERLVATMLATLVQAGGERAASPAEGKDRTCHPAHEHGTNRPLRKARPWCVCRGRGLRARLREMTGFAR
jgi:hypothetical protein